MDSNNSGHRDRLRERFLKAGSDAFSDHELLELLLFGVILRRDVKPLAKALLVRFGSLNHLIGAPIADIMQVKGIGESAAIHIKSLHAILLRAGQQELENKPIMNSWSALLSYLKLSLANETREQFRVLFLNNKLKLISDEIMGDGTIDHAPVYPREIARRALELAASSIILVHNHPSGDPKPSGNDISMTRKIIQSLQAIEVEVHDHIIVGSQGTVSMKAIGLI
ncbi:MAG: DNA repair protein RadC [Caulobacterales bacterium]|nr:DNA repair protein RadC [Caulobacterales bacterium]MCA0373911.1 DNA repair protein RadC [Pseudomonadota bacterium]